MLCFTPFIPDVITSNRIAQDLIDIMKELLENAATDCGYNPRVYKEILQVCGTVYSLRAT